MPVDYVELLNASSHPLFLVSAYDIAHSSTEHRVRINAALSKSKENGNAILMDSGNYEGFWKGDLSWDTTRLYKILENTTYEDYS